MIRCLPVAMSGFRRAKGTQDKEETLARPLSLSTVAMPMLARRRARRTRPNGRGEAGAGESHLGLACLVRLSGPRAPAMVSARRTRPHARGPQKSRLGRLTAFLGGSSPLAYSAATLP